MNNKDLLKQYVDTGLKLPVSQLRKLPNSLLQTYLRKRFIAIQNNDRDGYSDYEFNKLSDEYKYNYIEYVIKVGNDLSEFLFKNATTDQKKRYITMSVSNFFGLTNYEKEWYDKYKNEL